MPTWCDATYSTIIRAFVDFLSDSGSFNLLNIPTIKEWHSAMMNPIPESVKYAKAIKRITNAQPSIYTAVAYNDAVTTGIAFTAMSMDGVESAYQLNTDTEWREEFWLFIRTLNDMTAGSLAYKRAYVPSRSEIRDNIDGHRRDAGYAKHIHNPPINTTPATKPEHVTVDGAFHVALRAFAEHLPSPELAHLVESEPNLITAHTWTTMLSTEFDDASNDRDAKFLSTFNWKLFPDGVVEQVRSAFNTGVDPSAFVFLNQMNGFARVAKHVPANVMDHIEGYTSKLLADVRSGAVNIRNINLEQLGSAVLSKVSAKDMAALNANLESLLPILDNASFNQRR